jgi:hypothetical protein
VQEPWAVQVVVAEVEEPQWPLLLMALALALQVPKWVMSTLVVVVVAVVATTVLAIQVQAAQADQVS